MFLGMISGSSLLLLELLLCWLARIGQRLRGLRTQTKFFTSAHLKNLRATIYI